MERHGSHSHTGPYARKTERKSIFSKMKDSFKDIMYPSWLSGSGKNEDSGQQTSTAAELRQAPASTSAPIVGPGNPNLPPFHSQGVEIPNGQPRTQEFAVPETSSVDAPFQSPNLPPPISEFTSSLLPLNRLTEKSDSVLANEDTTSQRSDASKSTSGCSSMVPQQESGRQDSALGVEKRKALDQGSYASQQSPRSQDQQPTAKRPRLNVSLSSGNKTWTQRFNDTIQNQQPPGNLKRPAFNTSLFGSPFSEDTSVLGTSFHESSFYPGKTAYGGRSSFRSTQKRKVDLNQSLPSKLSFPVKSFKAKPRTNPIKEAVTSSTAKRILDVLDRMPTPVSDAKKIPVILSHNWTQNPSFFSKDVASTSVGPPTRRHTMGELASISTNRQTSAGSRQHEQENRNIIDNTAASVFTTAGLQKGDTVRLASDQQPSTSSGKIRREKSYHKGSSSVKPSIVEEDTVIVAPELRTDFTLPVSQIPQFSFNTPSIPKSSSQKTAPVNHQSALNFTFSSPIVERIPGNKPASPQNIGGFQFSSPISLDKKDEAHGTASSIKKPVSSFSTSISTTGNMQMAFSTAPKPKPSFNGPTFDAPSGGLKPATELKKGSVMDILGGSSKLTDTVTSSEAKATVPHSSLFKKVDWTSDTCLITNKDEANNCVSCQTLKPAPKQQNGAAETRLPMADLSKKGASIAPLTPGLKKQTGTTDIAKNRAETSNKETGNIPLSSLFKKSGWSCDVCLIDNKEDVDKCVACQNPRPGPKKDTGQQDKSKLFSKSSLLPGNWVCSTCLIQNKAEDNICGACKASKTGTSKQAPPKDDFMAKFKSSSGQWECEICLVQNKSDANTCVACQSQKPSKGFKQPTVDWVCDTCLVNNKAKDVKCVACNYSRPGPPKTQTVPICVKSFTMSQPSGFSFSSASTSDTSKNTGTANFLSTGGFKFGTTTSSSNGGFKFGASANSETTSNGSESTFKFGSDSSKSGSGSGFKFGIVKSGESDSNKSVSDIKFGSVNSCEDKLGKSAETVEEKGKDQKSIWTPGIGGFQFGKKSLSDSSNKPGGGFKFGSNTGVDSSSAIKPSGDLQFGVQNSSSAVGFQLGTTSSSSLVTSSSAAVTSISTLSNSTVSSSQAVVSQSDTLKMNTSAPSGFKLTTTGSFSSVTPVNKTLSEPSSKGETGLTVTSNSLKDTKSIAVTTSSFTGFAFGAPKVSEAKSEAQKPVFGGFSNKFTPSTTSTPAFGGFNFAQKKDEGQSFGSKKTGKSDSMATKRGRDEDSGETAAKKGNFVFGSNTSSSTPFQFGAANSAGQINSSPFGVGQTSSSTTQAGGFTFNMNKPNDTSKPLFGAPVTSTQTTAVPVFGNDSLMFNFTGQKSEAQNKSATTNASLFNNFGNGSVKSVTSSAGPTFNFGGADMNSTTFGSGTVNVFGGNAPSITPAFGSTPSVFGTKDPAPVTTAAPVFGGAGVFQFGSDKTDGSNQPQTNSVFAFGAKPAENTQSPASNTGFNFNSAQAGLGGTANFNFSQSAAPGAFAFSAAPAPPTGERKIKKAVRKLRR